MPPHAADLEEALKKKGGLTLLQLANYDDLITDALVDRVYFWSTIRKLKANYHACRGIHEEQVCRILQTHVIINKDPATAQEKLLRLPGLSKYHKSLISLDEREHFVSHLRKYINMYLPDCPFEVVTTNRYTIETAEAAITARRPIRRGEPIKYLSGIQVELTEREEKELSSNTDFSIVISSRRKRPSLFLGPARFANHDCQSNASLITKGAHGIQIQARKDIAIGEEITVLYGDDYFGVDNRECLCKTCENLRRNGWDPLGPILPDDSSDESEDDAEAVPNTYAKRKPAVSTTLKRKREHGDGEEDGEQSKKRRGRPPRYPHPSQKGGWKHYPARYDTRLDQQGPGFRGHFAPRGALEAFQQQQQQQQWGSSNSSFASSSRHTFPHVTTEAERNDPILDKVLRLLGCVADRTNQNMRTSELFPEPVAPTFPEPAFPEPAFSEPALPEPPVASVSVSQSYEEAMESDEDVEYMRNGRTTVRGPRGRFGKRASLPTASVMNSSTDTIKLSEQAGPSRTPTSNKLPSIKKERSASNLRNVMNATDSQLDPYSIQPSPSPTEPQLRKRGRTKTNALKEDVAADESSPYSAGTDNSPAASQASSATSMDTFGPGNIAEGICEMLTTGVDAEEGSKTAYNSESTIANSSGKMRTRGAARQSDTEDTQFLSPEKDERGRQPLRKSPRSGCVDVSVPPVRSIEDTDMKDVNEDGVSRGEPRKPGDYHLCETLLCTTYHRWVECRNCDEFFVQSEAYQTRIACPRCERHSKLYGYYWPKTDKNGKLDKEERILDHRLIHRFIDPEEERSEPKGRKALAEALRDKETSDRPESVDSERPVDRRFRLSPKRSESRRKGMRTTM